jgi:citrate lyase subunit beta/citryl-CoA lyase
VSPRRSVLVVPGSSERFLIKASTAPADMVLLDLEDGVAGSEKAAARRNVVAAIARLDWGERIVAVRVNGWSSGETVRDLTEIVIGAGARLDVVVLPKVYRPEEVVALELVLDDLEGQSHRRDDPLGIEVLIETASALSNVATVCASSPRLEAVAIGPGDLGAELGIPTLALGAGADAVNPFLYLLSSILVAARTHGLQAIDGAFGALADEDGLRRAASMSMALGFDGKWAIHPDQLRVVNDVFTPDAATIARAEAILAALEAGAADGGAGAVRSGGEMVDAASGRLARQVLRRQAGALRRPSPPRDGER